MFQKSMGGSGNFCPLFGDSTPLLGTQFHFGRFREEGWQNAVDLVLPSLHSCHPPIFETVAACGTLCYSKVGPQL